MFESNLKDIVKKVNERKPDIIVFTGDLIDKDYKLSSKEQEKVIKELQKLNASLGKYAIFGDEDNEQFKIILNQCNFNILKNSYDLIYQNDNNPILLIGLSSDKKKQNIDKAKHFYGASLYYRNLFGWYIPEELRFAEKEYALNREETPIINKLRQNALDVLKQKEILNFGIVNKIIQDKKYGFIRYNVNCSIYFNLKRIKVKLKEKDKVYFSILQEDNKEFADCIYKIGEK